MEAKLILLLFIIRKKKIEKYYSILGKSLGFPT